MLSFKKLRKLRISLGFTQEQVAKKCGIAQSHYAQAELGLRAPSLAVVCMMAATLRVGIEEIVEVKKCYQQKGL